MKILHKRNVKRYCVKYFNGFSLDGEEVLFEEYFFQSSTCVVGFSYGAQKAFEYAYTSRERIDKLILLSPAFFQHQNPSFVRTQLRYFNTSQTMYVKQFLTNVTSPSNKQLSPYLDIGTKNELEALLTYIWNEEKIEKLIQRGIDIEVFLGEKDKIIDTQSASEFFSKYTTVYYIKDVGHLLRS